MYINFPLFYTGSEVLNSGIANINGNIAHKTAIFSGCIAYKYKKELLYNYNPLYTYQKPSYFTSTAYIDPKDDILTCSGCASGLGFNYFVSASSSYKTLQIFSSTNYIYSAATKGLQIYDYNANLLCTKKIDNKKVKTVWGNNTNLYIGTQDGLYTITHDDPCNNTPVIYNTNLSSNNINYVHGISNELFICTDSGVEYIHQNCNPAIHTKTNITGAKKCFLTKNAGYYITTSSGKDTLNKIKSCLCDWSVPDKIYTTGSGIFKEGIKLSDLYITTETAKNGGNTIFCATTSGVYVIDEDTEKYAIFYTRN